MAIHEKKISAEVFLKIKRIKKDSNLTFWVKEAERRYSELLSGKVKIKPARNSFDGAGKKLEKH